ncbi:uncharacterized protein LOC112171226 [Rosa chinensis]|uniref:uncharacterized protein LOC112171226 n=1 Tax=Rosa chinensis TaxID=74649 RepID=UPI000D08EB3F|nr:uncharacterized protein LOC112171226 [Rosa chinensis]
MRWIIGNGKDIKFYTFNWVIDHPLLNYILEDRLHLINIEETVSDYISNNTWNKNKLSSALDPPVVDQILGISLPVMEQQDEYILTLTDAENMLLESNIKKDARALYIIQMGLSNEIFPRVSNEIKAKDAWDVLEKEYRGTTKSVETAFQSLNVSSKGKWKAESSSQQNKPKVEKNWKSTNQKNKGKRESIGIKASQSVPTVRDLGMFKKTAITNACSNHMTANKSLLIDIDTSVTPRVRMDDGNLAQSQGRGTLVVETKKGRMYIKEVMIVPNLAENLLSVGQLIEHGYYVDFGDNSCAMYGKRDRTQQIAKVKMEGNSSFPITLNYSASPSKSVDVSWKHLKEKDMVHGLPIIQEASEICEGCAVGKQHIDSFPKEKAWRASKPLELIHSDVCGPMNTATHGERQSGFLIKTLRSDRGGDYNSKEFDKFCNDLGLERQLTTTYTPQQNGVAKRKNMTIVEMAKSMLHEKGLPYVFWGEAVNTTVYLMNRCPTKAVKDLTPFESLWDWKSKYVQISTLQVGEDNEGEEFEEEAGYFQSHVHSPQPTSPQPPQSQASTPSSTPIRTRSLCDVYASCNFCVTKPETYDEVIKDVAWKKAMVEEISVIEKNSTWDLVNRPSDKIVIGVKWLYKTKLNIDGYIQRNKARLVAKGYSQQPGVDFHETYAPIARLDTIRALIALATQKNWSLYQLDVQSAFLNGVLNEEVYVEQPQGFVTENEEHKVYKLKKALYSLKQAPRAWYGEIDSHFIKDGFQRSENEPTLYIKTKGNTEILIVSIYVDDLVFTGSCEEMVLNFKNEMMKKYEMSDLGLLHYFLGIGVSQSENGIFVSQKKYAKSILEKFGMGGCKFVAIPLIVNEKLSKDDGSKPVDTSVYRSLVGSLLYLTATRPDVMYAASLLSRFMHNPTQMHLGTAKRVLRYIQGSIDFGMMNRKNIKPKLFGFCDSDWSGSLDDSKSTSGYAFTIGSGVFSWGSNKQQSVALSTTEVEYVSAAEATSQAIWLRRILEDFGAI